jgi:hypothetical protein
LRFNVLSSARFSIRSVRRLIFAERITPTEPTTTAAHAISETNNDGQALNPVKPTLLSACLPAPTYLINL